MTAPALSIVDFQNLLQPGELGEIDLDIKNAIAILTTTAMSGVTAANVQALGPMIVAIKNASSVSQLAPPSGVAPDPSLGDPKPILAKYATAPTPISGYTPPTVALPSTSGATVLANTNSTYATLFKCIIDSIDDLGGTLIPIVIQQNATKTDAATVTALANMITTYVVYINGIVGTFILNTSGVDPNYDKIIGNIEKILSKMNITIPAPGTVNITALVPLVEPYTGPPLTAPLPAIPSGKMNLATSNGSDTGSGFATHFPTPTQIITQAPLFDPKTNKPYSPPVAPRLPPAGAVITGIEFLQPNTKVVSVQTNYPLPNSPTTMGYLITIDKPLVGWQNEIRGNVWWPTFTYPPIASEDYEAQNYPAILAAYNATARATPDPIVTEMGKSINNSINAIINGNTVGTYNSAKNIALIKTIPGIIDTMVSYITSQMSYLNTIGTGSFTQSQLAPIYPLSDATKKMFTTLTPENFVANMTTSGTGILRILIMNYTSNFSLNVIKKTINKSPTSGQSVTLASSVGTKLFKLHFSILNTLIKVFNINLTADPPIQPLLAIVTKTFGDYPDNLITNPPKAGGRRRRITRKRKQKSRRQKKTKKQMKRR